MAASPLKLAELRETIGQITGAAKKEFMAAPGMPMGIPKGAIVEVAGHLKDEWLIEFLKANESLQVFWLERDPTIFPTALTQRGIDLERVTFSQAPERYPVLRQSLQSQLFEVIIAPSLFDEDRILKGLQLLTEKSNCVLFLVTKQLKAAWPIAVQIDVSKKNREGRLEVNVVKHKFVGIS